MRHSVKRKGNLWKSSRHPTRHLWEQDGVEILRRKQVTESQVFLFVFLPEQRLSQSIGLSDGESKLEIKCELPQNSDYAMLKGIAGTPSHCFDMAVFGLVVCLAFNKIVHFCLEGMDKTWHTEVLQGKRNWTMTAFRKEKKDQYAM